MGVPTLGCRCAVCTSEDPHDRRLRPSLLLRWREGLKERVVVIDTGPDFREQALRSGLTRVDAVLYTHGHADHILGLDDLRPLSFIAFAGGRSDSAVCFGGYGRGAAPDLRLHLLAGCDLCDARPGAD